MSNNRVRKNTRKNWGFGFKLLILTCIIFFIWAGYVLSYAAPLLFLDGGNSDPEKEEIFKKGQFVVVLAGSDIRPEETKSRSDTLMMAFVDTKQKSVRILSIPRDTYVAIPGHSNGTRINHAHAYGGIDLTQKTLKENFDIDTDYYIDINFDGFAGFIDAIGGVEIDVEKRMYYPAEGIDLQPGLQRLNGYDALAYVRYRSDGMGDLGRIVRQQKFMAALADQMLSPSMITKLPGALSAISKNMDTNFSTKELVKLASIFKEDASVETFSLPNDPKYKGGVSYVFVVEPDSTELINKLKSYYPRTDTASTNGESGVTGE